MTPRTAAARCSPPTEGTGGLHPAELLRYGRRLRKSRFRYAVRTTPALGRHTTWMPSNRRRLMSRWRHRSTSFRPMARISAPRTYTARPYASAASIAATPNRRACVQSRAWRLSRKVFVRLFRLGAMSRVSIGASSPLRPLLAFYRRRRRRLAVSYRQDDGVLGIRRRFSTRRGWGTGKQAWPGLVGPEIPRCLRHRWRLARGFPPRSPTSGARRRPGHRPIAA